MNPAMIPLLRKAVEWAEVEAEKPIGQWDQEYVYISEEARVEIGVPQGCGSTYCIAGWVVVEHYGVENPHHATNQSILTHAGELLGLGYDQQYLLFSGDNSIEDVRRIAEEIAGERL